MVCAKFPNPTGWPPVSRSDALAIPPRFESRSISDSIMPVTVQPSASRLDTGPGALAVLVVGMDFAFAAALAAFSDLLALSANVLGYIVRVKNTPSNVLVQSAIIVVP